MKPTLSFAVLLLLLILMACNPNRVYESYHDDFPDHRWNQTKAITYTADITDVQSPYNITLALRHIYGFQFDKMIVKVESTTPSGTVSNKEYEMKVMKILLCLF